jgi:hypothetical protein
MGVVVLLLSAENPTRRCFLIGGFKALRFQRLTAERIGGSDIDQEFGDTSAVDGKCSVRSRPVPRLHTSPSENLGPGRLASVRVEARSLTQIVSPIFWNIWPAWAGIRADHEQAQSRQGLSGFPLFRQVGVGAKSGQMEM